MKKKISLKDIAQKVGVSTALVSYVLNNKKEGRIGKEVSEKIRQVAIKLNYRPNLAARSLKTNRSNTIGLIVSDISNPFSSTLARIIENEASLHKYNVIFGSSDESDARLANLINVFEEQQVDGMIIAPVDKSEKYVKEIQDQGIPLVLIDRFFPSLETNTILIDNFKAAYDATMHLISKERVNIGLISFKSGLFNLLERKAGYKAALKKAGLKILPSRIKEVRMESLRSDVEQALDEIISSNHNLDAILFASNNISTFALKHLVKKKIPIPDQLAVVAIDETDASELFYAPLTCMRQPLQEMGKLAVQTLMRELELKSLKKKNSKCTHHVLYAELIVRRSSDANIE